MINTTLGKTEQATQIIPLPEVFGLTFKQMEHMADTILKIGEHMNFVKDWNFN
jgi:hypothetical protein